MPRLLLFIGGAADGQHLFVEWRETRVVLPGKAADAAENVYRLQTIDGEDGCDVMVCADLSPRAALKRLVTYYCPSRPPPLGADRGDGMRGRERPTPEAPA